MASGYARDGSANESFCEQEIRIRIIVGKLAQLSAAIRRSGSDNRHQRADTALNDGNRAELENHFRFILAIGLRESRPDADRLTTEEFVQEALCFEKLTAIQERLVHANVLRQNRIEFVIASPGTVYEETETDRRLRSKIPRVLATAEITQSEIRDVMESANAPNVGMPTAATHSNARTATSLGSTFDLKEKPTPSVTTKITRTGEMQDYPRRPKAEGDQMTLCPYCKDPLTAEDLKNDRRWR